MISGLKGKLTEKDYEHGKIHIECHGVVYEVLANPDRFSAEIGSDVAIYIWHVLREDSQSLFGFDTKVARNAAIQAAEADRVGPTTAARLFQVAPYPDIVAAVQSNNPDRLAGLLKGLGKVKAESIIRTCLGKLPTVSGASGMTASQIAYIGYIKLGMPEDEKVRSKLEELHSLNPEMNGSDLLAFFLQNKARFDRGL